MPDSIKPVPIKVVSRVNNTPPPDTARNWGGFTKMGIGEVRSSTPPPSSSPSSSPWGGLTRRGLGHRFASGSLTTQRFHRARFEAAQGGGAYYLDEIWMNFPWWWVSVIMASGFAFALGATLALLIPR